MTLLVSYPGLTPFPHSGWQCNLELRELTGQAAIQWAAEEWNYNNSHLQENQKIPQPLPAQAVQFGLDVCPTQLINASFGPSKALTFAATAKSGSILCMSKCVGDVI